MKPLSVSCPEVLIEGCPLGILLSIDSGNRSVDQGLQLSVGAYPCMVASTLVRFAVTFTDVDVDVRELIYGAQSRHIVMAYAMVFHHLLCLHSRAGCLE
jgi:hypothetical protein